MAILTATTTAQLQTHLTNSVGGDIIEVAAGTYALTTMSGLSKASEVIIRPANRNTPPLWEARAFELTGATNLTFDGLTCIGAAVESVKNGIAYPAETYAMRFNGCTNIKVVNCLIRFHHRSLRFDGCTNLEIAYCDVDQGGNDYFNGRQGSSHNVHIHHCAFVDERVDGTIITQGDRHADTAHCIVLPSSVAAGNPWTDLVIEDNLMVWGGTGSGTDKSGKPLFLNIEGAPDSGIGYIDTIIRRNFMQCGRGHGIYLNGHQNVLIDGCVLRSNPGTVTSEIPRIAISSDAASCTGLVNNTVVASHLQVSSAAPYYAFGTGSSIAGMSATNCVESDTAFPTGWVDLVQGVNVGRYTGGGGTPPTTPAVMTFPADAVMDGVVELPEAPGRYTGVVKIPTASKAFAVAGNSNMSWLPSGATQARGFRVANPAAASDGGLRFELYSGGDTTINTVAAGATMSGITMRYRVNGVWSAWSADTLSFTAPGTPPAQTLTPLAGNQWEFYGSVYAVAGLPGRFTQNVRLIGTAPTVNALKWTPDGETAWRDAMVVSGGYQLLPLVGGGGADHTVGYEETLSIRLSYSTAAQPVFSAQSATAKGFTGPNAPATPFDGGDRLVLSSEYLYIAGWPMTIPTGTRPSPISTDEILVSVTAGVATVQLPASPPIGATSQVVLYAGGKYPTDANGVATFTVIAGKTICLARGIGANGEGGPALYFYLPA